MTELETAIEQAKKLDTGTYLLLVRRGAILRSVLDRISTKDVRFIIVETHGDPLRETALYRIEPEKPL